MTVTMRAHDRQSGYSYEFTGYNAVATENDITSIAIRPKYFWP
jgi:hypothetical protein